MANGINRMVSISSATTVFDLYTVRGQYVRAAHDGIVTFVGSDSKGGWGVEIRTKDPRDYNGKEVYFRTIYWHLIPNIPVRAGQEVKVGDIIGYADSTGFSTGDHLHFALKPIIVKENEMWYNVEQDNGYFGAIDPMPYLVGMFAEDYASISNKIKEIADKISELFKKIKGR